MTSIDAELLEAQIDRIRETADVKKFKTGETEVDTALHGGSMGYTSNAEDKVTLYHTQTGEARTILVNMLRHTLSKKLSDGRPAFSMTPTVEFKLGVTKCWLHPEHEDREWLDSIGLGGIECQSGHLRDGFNAEMHMMRKHSQEHRVIRDARDRQEREEERAFRRAMMENMNRRRGQ